MAVDGVSFSSLDTNKVHNTPGRLDAAEIAVAHRAGCIWAREGQDEETYNNAQEEFVQIMKRGNYKEIYEYREQLENEIVQSELPKHVKGEKYKITPSVYQELVEFDIKKRMNRNIFISRERATQKAIEYVNEHFVVMSEEQILDRYQRAYNALWKLNNTVPENERKTDEELKAMLPEDISEIATYFMNFVRSYK